MDCENAQPGVTCYAPVAYPLSPAYLSSDISSSPSAVTWAFPNAAAAAAPSVASSAAITGKVTSPNLSPPKLLDINAVELRLTQGWGGGAVPSAPTPPQRPQPSYTSNDYYCTVLSVLTAQRSDRRWWWGLIQKPTFHTGVTETLETLTHDPETSSAKEALRHRHTLSTANYMASARSTPVDAHDLDDVFPERIYMKLYRSVIILQFPLDLFLPPTQPMTTPVISNVPPALTRLVKQVRGIRSRVRR